MMQLLTDLESAKKKFIDYFNCPFEILYNSISDMSEHVWCIKNQDQLFYADNQARLNTDDAQRETIGWNEDKLKYHIYTGKEYTLIYCFRVDDYYEWKENIFYSYIMSNSKRVRN